MEKVNNFCKNTIKKKIKQMHSMQFKNLVKLSLACKVLQRMIKELHMLNIMQIVATHLWQQAIIKKQCMILEQQSALMIKIHNIMLIEVIV